MPGQSCGFWKGALVVAEHFADYLETAGAQIQWNRARPPLLQELQTHLEEQKADCLAAGMTPEMAEQEAIRQMGDPVQVGTALNEVHRPRPQLPFLIWALALALLCGFLRVWLTAGWQDAVSPLRTALAAGAGTAALLGAYFADYTVLRRYPRRIYLGGLALTALSLLLSPRVNGASYYTRYLVLFFPLLYALWIFSWRKKSWKGLVWAVIGGIPPAVLSALTPHLSGLLLFFFTGLLLLLWAARQNWFGIGRWKTAIPVLGGALALFTAGLLRIWSSGRLIRALHPELDPYGAGYQGMTVRAVLSRAPWISASAAGGSHSETLIPEGARDFLPATLVGRLGWFPWLLLLAGLFFLLGWLLLRCRTLQNSLGTLLVLASVFPLLLRGSASVILNLGVVFFSVSCPLLVGNLQSVLDLACIGLVLSAFRQDALPWTAPAPLTFS